MGTPTLPSIPARVVAGAALLDRRRPAWHHQIDPARLDMEDCRVDVLGQLFGWFETGVRELAPDLEHSEQDAWIIAHGFDLDDADLLPKGSSIDNYRVLTDAWRGELARRRGGEAS
jgi:hypothetical protein